MKNAFLEQRQVDHKELSSLKGMYLVLQLILLCFQIRTGKVKFLDLRACGDHSLSPYIHFKWQRFSHVDVIRDNDTILASLMLLSTGNNLLKT